MVDYTELSANLFSAKLLTQFRLARASRGRGKESFSKIFIGRRKNRCFLLFLYKGAFLWKHTLALDKIKVWVYNRDVKIRWFFNKNMGKRGVASPRIVHQILMDSSR